MSAGVWIIGARGMLGAELLAMAGAAGFQTWATDREVDIRDQSALEVFASGKNIAWVVNCAAYTAVDKAEDEPVLCRELNSDGPAIIAAVARNMGARLVHVSTDYVFDGQGIQEGGSLRSWREDDTPGPTGAYGASKLAGEQRVLAADTTAIILRTAWLYGAGGPNFVHTMLRLMAEKPELGVVADQFGSPTWTRDLCSLILTIMSAPPAPGGIYHASGEGMCSWHEFACTIQAMAFERGLLQVRIPVKPLSSDQYPTKARRPAWSVLSKAKIKAVWGVGMPDWKTSLARFLDEKASSHES